MDALFTELDGDGSGELDLKELISAVKRLKIRCQKVEKKNAEAKAEESHWYSRASEIRAAAEQVVFWENSVTELQERRTKPSVELGLANLLSKTQLKPSDLLAKMDTNNDKSIDAREFARGMQALGSDATSAELEAYHKQLAGKVWHTHNQTLASLCHGVGPMLVRRGARSTFQPWLSLPRGERRVVADCARGHVTICVQCHTFLLHTDGSGVVSREAGGQRIPRC